MKVYVTGASGFIGRRIVDALVARGHTVVAITRDSAKIPPRPGVEVRQVDLLKLETVLPAIEDCTGGVHAAGAGASASDADLHAGNVQVSRHVAGSARRFERLKRLVALTSAAVLEPGDTPYRRVKIGQEAAIRTYGLALTVLRPTLVLGPWQESTELKALVGRLRGTKAFPLVGGGTNRIQPVFVDDVANAAATALERDATIGKFLTIAGPEEGIPWRDLVAEVRRRVGGKAPLRSLPRLPLKAAAAVMSLAGQGQQIRAALTYYGHDHLYPLGEAKELLGYQPKSYADSLRIAFGE